MASANVSLVDSPIFIVGPPRSGTTLLYQLLVQRYRFVYFSNFMGKYATSPVAAYRLEKQLLDRRFHSNYRSEYGRTIELAGPHEAGAFWYRWFPKGDHVYVAPGETPHASLIELRREVLALSHAAQTPVLFKNTYNSMRIAPIIEALPQALFLVMRRDPVDSAQSILRGRIDVQGTKDDWWSLPPRQIDEIRGHPYWEQVVEQVYYTYKQIQEDRVQFGPDHFFDVSYEQLCQDTYQTLSEIKRFLSSRGVDVDVRGNTPREFPMSTGQKVDDEDYQLITETVNRLWTTMD